MWIHVRRSRRDAPAAAGAHARFIQEMGWGGLGGRGRSQRKQIKKEKINIANMGGSVVRRRERMARRRRERGLRRPCLVRQGQNQRAWRSAAASSRPGLLVALHGSESGGSRSCSDALAGEGQRYEEVGSA